jgi:hypothetical protein
MTIRVPPPSGWPSATARPRAWRRLARGLRMGLAVTFGDLALAAMTLWWGGVLDL